VAFLILQKQSYTTLARIVSSESNVSEVNMKYDNSGTLINLEYTTRTASVTVKSGNSTDIIPSRDAFNTILLVFKNGVKVLEGLSGDLAQTLTVRYFKDPDDESKSYLFYDFRKGSIIVDPDSREPTLSELLASGKKIWKMPKPGLRNLGPRSRVIAPDNSQPLESRMVLCFQGDEPKYMLRYMYFGENRPDTSALFEGYSFNMSDNLLEVASYGKQENVRLMTQWRSTVVKYRGNAVIDAIQETRLSADYPPSRTIYDNQYYSVSGVLVGYSSSETKGESTYARPIKTYELLTNGR